MSFKPFFFASLLTAAVLISGCSDAPGEATNLAGQDTLRILAYNIHHGAGMDLELDLDRIAKLIRDLNPDLVALQEIDSIVTRTEGVDQAAVLGRLTGMESVFGEFMPYQGGKYGMAAMSKWPIIQSTNHRLPDGSEPRSSVALHVKSPKTGRELHFVSIHFYETESERLAQAQALAGFYEGVEEPVILAGDYNSEPDSPVIAFLKQQWGFVDKGENHFTFSSFEPVKEIDYFALRPFDAFTVIDQFIVEEPVASDHSPIFIEVVW
ncbi:endonuclease/exonuclease/phosphatase family protein [bacterium]|nr:endonuclease/exonuclease/phosphatase family protein [bacterium]